MTLADLLREHLEIEDEDGWGNKRTPTPVRCFAVRLHSMGLSFREVEGVLGWLGVDCCFQAVWNWKEKLAEEQSDPPTATPSRVAIDETQIEVDGETKWLYAAIDIESKLLLEVDVSSNRGTDPAAAFFHRLTKKHDVADTEFLVDGMGYLTALARHDLSGQLNYTERNYIEKWFQTLTMRIDRFHSYWQGSQQSAQHWLCRFRHYSNRHRPNQALDGRTPAQEELN